MLINILDILVPIYATVIFGYLLGRREFPWVSRTIVPLILQISLPCLIVSHFSKQKTVPDGLVEVLISAGIIFTILLGIFYLLLRLFKMPLRTFLGAASLQNMSIGLALGFLGFGNTGFALALGYASVILFAQFTLGWWIPEGRINVKRTLSQITIYGIILGLLLMFVHIQPPSYIDKTLSLIGQLAIPLLLFSLGFSLAGIKITRFPKNLVLSAIHLTICLGIGISTALLMGLENDAFVVVVLLSMLPSSTINLLMGKESGADMPPMTMFIFCTNIWLVITLPIGLVLLLPS